jgi:glycine/D-amino acid oxidase-like deaminating enzyme
MMVFDKIIIGAGLYGLYSAYKCKDQKVLVLECDSHAFSRATYVNQARVHMGYHYPRSYSTAIKSARYFERFNDDFGFCVEREFEKIYAISDKFSWTSAHQFKKFCDYSKIDCEQISPTKYFNDSMCQGAFLTKEYTYDAMILKDYYLEKLRKQDNIQIRYNSKISDIKQLNDHYQVSLESGEVYSTDFLLNATYASTNQISNMLGFDLFNIKYELCEIILCEVSEKLKDVGITVMDGPFFSIMPFGKTGLHSLTSVTFTPHVTSYDRLPNFKCQANSDGYCSPQQLGNCNTCPAKPQSAYSYMSNLAKKYLKEEYGFSYHSSLFSMKPILQASEIDDSRPTVIKQFSNDPTFISVLSGKINTVYDLDEFLV